MIRTSNVDSEVATLVQAVRSAALRKIIEIEANRRADVLAFRKRFLRGQVLDPRSPSYARRVNRMSQAAQDALILVAEALARDFDLESPGLGIAFVLTGSGLGSLMFPKCRWLRPKDYPAATRLRIEVPLSCTPGQLAAYYSSVRRDAHPKPPRQRALTAPWRADLAVFATHHKPGLTWSELRELWNQAGPEREYEKEEVALFSRDARAAYRRIAGREPKWPSKERPKRRGQ